MKKRQALILLLVAAAAVAHHFLPFKLASLSLYLIPLVLSHDLSTRNAFSTAVLCILSAGVIFYVNPDSFRVNSPLDIMVILSVWAACMVVAAVLPSNPAPESQGESASKLPTESSAKNAQAVETNKVLGLLFQGQGMLDLAFEKFKLCPVDTEFKDLLYNLGLDYEHKGLNAKAISVYAYILDTDPKYRDASEKVRRLGQLPDSGSTTGQSGTAPPGATLMVQGVPKTKLGRYELQKELGRGAMGIVYQGHDPNINRQVALKTLRLDSDLTVAALKEAKERFFREAESAGKLNHSNIVRIFDAGEEQGICYIAMELLDGEDFTRYTKVDSLLPVRQVLEYAAQVADALQYAHAQGIIHRDIKPANVMYLKDGTIRVADFGIARIASSSKTETGVVIGTLAYMSPEQISGKKVDGRSDIFSLGIVLFELLTGQKPFQDTGELANIFFRITNQPEPEPADISPDVPPCASQIIHKALKKNPEERYQRGSEMAVDLRACAANIPDQPRKSFEQRLRARVDKIARETPLWIARGGSPAVLQARVAEFKRLVQAGERQQAESVMDEIVGILSRDPVS